MLVPVLREVPAHQGREEAPFFMYCSRNSVRFRGTEDESHATFVPIYLCPHLANFLSVCVCVCV